MNYHAVLQTLHQIRARVTRLGAKNPEKVVQQHTTSSFHDTQFRTAFAKHAKLMMAEVDLSSWLPDTLRLLIAYNAIATHWGHTFNIAAMQQRRRTPQWRRHFDTAT
jgi:hypothetical protein